MKPWLFPVVLSSFAWLVVAACDTPSDEPSQPSTPSGPPSVPPPPTPSATDTPAPPPPPKDAGVDATAPKDAGVDASEPPKPCHLPVEQKGFVGTKELPFGNPPRTYDLYIGENYDGDTPLPVLFVFHGDGGTGAIIRSWTHLEWGTGQSAIIVYPNNPYKTWDIDTEPKTNPDYHYVDQMIEDVAQTVCIDRKRIFGWGISRGAFFANQLGCFRGDKFRGIVAHSGGGPQSNDPADRNDYYYFTGCTTQPTSAVIIHAYDDKTVSYGTGIDSRDHWIIANGCKPDTTSFGPSPCVAYTNCATKNLVGWCAISGGHAFWDASVDMTWKLIESLK